MTKEELFHRSLPEPNSGCWLWLGSTRSNGYGQVEIKGKNLSTHRLSYQLYKGDIPKGLLVLHSCDVRCCGNPDHLRVGTQKDNMNDRKLRGKNTCKENNPSSILSEKEVLSIRKKYGTGDYTLKALGTLYGVHLSTIHCLVKHKTWVGMEDEG